MNHSQVETMPLDIDEIIEKAFEQAFCMALEQTLQRKAEALFKSFCRRVTLGKKVRGQN